MDTFTEKSDKMLLHLKSSKASLFYVTPDQAELIKSNWRTLHEFDPDHEYTFSSDFRRLRKDGRKKKSYRLT